jgi:hypothetical protein
MTLRESRAFVDRVHRHHRAPVGGLFAIGAEVEGAIVAVAIVGRPIARGLQDDFTAEVTRLASIGARNACSMLYAACWRACRAMGYRRLVSYTLETESGASLIAAGWRCVAQIPAKSWNTPSRARVDLYPLQGKFRWEKLAS